MGTLRGNSCHDVEGKRKGALQKPRGKRTSWLLSAVLVPGNKREKRPGRKSPGKSLRGPGQRKREREKAITDLWTFMVLSGMPGWRNVTGKEAGL